MASSPKDVLPDAVFRTVENAIPMDLRSHVIVIGSLAAAYWITGEATTLSVRTKDVDTVLVPRHRAPQSGQEVADKLLEENWRPKREGEFGAPGTDETPDEKLPALRLYPPKSEDWFLEFLTESDGEVQGSRQFMRFVLSNGEHYGLPSFQFTRVATFGAVKVESGIRVARPEMMALANLLEHPTIKPDVVKGTTTKRSNKDIGRALALAWLNARELDSWAAKWTRALQTRFPGTWREFARRTGDGVKALLASEPDFDQAVTTCNNGLLASRRVEREPLRVTADRLLQLVVTDVEAAASRDESGGIEAPKTKNGP